MPSYYNTVYGVRKYNYVYFAHSKELRLWEESPYTEDRYYHSWLAGGKNVDCAGEIATYEGRIISVNAETGHYYKTPINEFNQCALEVQNEIRRLGYDLSDLGKTANQLQNDAWVSSLDDAGQ